MEQNVWMGLRVWVYGVLCMCFCTWVTASLIGTYRPMPPWKCVRSVRIFFPREKILCLVPFEWLRQTECVFIKRLWVVLLASFTLRKKKASYWTFSPSQKIIWLYSHHTVTLYILYLHCLNRTYWYLWHHWCSFEVYIFFFFCGKRSMCLCSTVRYILRIGKTTYSKDLTSSLSCAHIMTGVHPQT